MSPTTQPELAPAAFWAVAHGVDHPLGEGEHGWYPYELRSEVLAAAHRLTDPVDAYRELLLAEHDAYWREVLLFLTALNPDPQADDLLLSALTDAQLRARALYLLGVSGGKGWPRRPEREPDRILRAIAPWVEDATPYTDVVYATIIPTGDYARGALVRVAGREHFPALRDAPGHLADFIGLSVPEFSDQTRRALSADIRAYLHTAHLA